MSRVSSPPDSTRAAELIAALSLATDLGMGFPLEHGLRSTLLAMRLADRLNVDVATARQTYYACLLFYIGCTADAEVAAAIFAEGALLTHFTPVTFGSAPQTMAGVMRALAGEGPAVTRALRVARALPGAARGHKRHVIALCEVAEMLTARVGLPADIARVAASFVERWDGKGAPARLRGEEIPLAVRIAQVARDAAFQHRLGGREYAVRMIAERAGHAFDPRVAAELTGGPADIWDLDPAGSVWDEVLEREPPAHLMLRGEQIDGNLAAMADFADLLSPYLAGHSSGVSTLAAASARHCGLGPSVITSVRRAAYVHDIGRVAIGAQVWQKPTALTVDEWERVRLHAYYTERVLNRSPLLAGLIPVATSHHERLDGNGYHRGVGASTLSLPARLLAAADAYQAMTSPRPHREALTPEQASRQLRDEVAAARLDAESVSAVLAAAGQSAPRLARPAGLTEREVEVIGLLAYGLPTKQIARTLGISAKTADRHIQHAYAKIGVSSRAAAALFAMEHGLAVWGELPIVRDRSGF